MGVEIGVTWKEALAVVREEVALGNAGHFATVQATANPKVPLTMCLIFKEEVQVALVF